MRLLLNPNLQISDKSYECWAYEIWWWVIQGFICFWWSSWSCCWMWRHWAIVWDQWRSLCGFLPQGASSCCARPHFGHSCVKREWQERTTGCWPAYGTDANSALRCNNQAPVTIEQEDATCSRTPTRPGYIMIAYESQWVREAHQRAGYAGEPKTASIKRKWRQNENENPQTTRQRQTLPKATSTHPRAMFRTRKLQKLKP
jgi:hypothetical protein